MFKKSNHFVIGGYARCVGFGVRIYRVVDVGDYEITLQRMGDTNKGVFKFSTSKRKFKASDLKGNLSWYTPVTIG